MPKPNKAIRKRIKFTKTGKLMRRVAGQNHFNAKESRRRQRRKGVSRPFPRALAREIKNRL